MGQGHSGSICDPRFLHDQNFEPAAEDAGPSYRLPGPSKAGGAQKLAGTSVFEAHHRTTALVHTIDDESASCLKCQGNILQVRLSWSPGRMKAAVRPALGITLDFQAAALDVIEGVADIRRA